MLFLLSSRLTVSPVSAQPSSLKLPYTWWDPSFQSFDLQSNSLDLNQWLKAYSWRYCGSSPGIPYIAAVLRDCRKSMVGYTKTGVPKANGLQLRPRPPSSPTSACQAQLKPLTHSNSSSSRQSKRAFTILLLKCTLYGLCCLAGRSIAWLAVERSSTGMAHIPFLFCSSILSFFSTSLSSISSTFPLIYQIQIDSPLNSRSCWFGWGGTTKNSSIS